MRCLVLWAQRSVLSILWSCVPVQPEVVPS